MISAEMIREKLKYDPVSGEFSWRKNSGRHGRYPAESRAGFQKDGYWMITICGRDYRAHRLAWLYVHGEWPLGQIDHRDLNRSNNSIGNLRCATRSQNGANRRALKNNSSGHKGVSWYRWSGKWKASIKKGRVIHLGYFDTKEAAAAAYREAAIQYHGEFARVS
jgi:hypothetical protein